ncbi:MAG: ABC transporter ATP-binding protein, partial [Bacteroidales bacterium]|nr:ABC transporter ATP-binding protein [Bacteroidales bacterium]
EPTAGLDPGNARIMKDIILDMQKKGTTIFLTTHHMADAGELCNRLAFMVDGALPVIDSTQKLRLEHGRKVVRVEYLDKQEKQSLEFELKGLSSNLKFLDIIQNKELLTIHTLEASLEDIFIKITGQQLIR